MPERIQRKRTKGWRMPPNTVYVGRPTKWGNPFKAGRLYVDASTLVWETLTPERAVELYKDLMDGPDIIADIRFSLVGKNLACWCPIGTPCHTDVLLEWANQ